MISLQECIDLCAVACPNRRLAVAKKGDTYSWLNELEGLREYALEKGQWYALGAKSFTVIRQEGSKSSPLVRQKVLWGECYTSTDGLPVGPYEVVGMYSRMKNEAIGCKHKHNPQDTHHYRAIATPAVWHYYYSKPSWNGRGAYCDIHAAYWSIYSAIGQWDLRYRRGRSLCYGHVTMTENELGWLRKSKDLRNGLIGISGCHKAEIYKPNGDRVRVPSFGRSNFPLALITLDTLQCVMAATHEKFRSVCHYCNTDGLIVDEPACDDVIDYWANVWGLDGEIKARGMGAVRGIGAYRLGDHISAPFETQRIICDKTFFSCSKDLDTISAVIRLEVKPLLLAKKLGSKK